MGENKRDGRDRDLAQRGSSAPDVGPSRDVDAFLKEARAVATPAAPAGRLIFALDATMSRQPTWDLACQLQAEMFDTALAGGGLAVQLVYFRGFGECRASRWVSDAGALTALMTRIDCRGGLTQIGRVLAHARNEVSRSGAKVLVLVGDAVEEDADGLCALAGELGLLGVRIFAFQEGHDATVTGVFKELSRLTGGAYARFDSGAGTTLAALLRGAAAYASGGLPALQRLADRDGGEVRGLLTAMGGKR
ncbi:MULTISPECIES: hypothetical protein [Chelatococcus]|uniref:VWA domain-containing protein n=1 Tax=Chelatococcus daeguensis TaxID=444444 RepID=A0AAC9JPF9_9HYPH|nr:MULTISPECIES: hypothetical protein [Chelatococcus]APF37737.1 hypothetical protein BOQ54_10715 [Chelatococcus daeguensis]